MIKFSEYIEKQDEILLEATTKQLLDCLMRLKSIDPNCWQEFRDKFEPDVRSYLMSKTRDYEDILQTFWLKLFDKFNKLKVQNCKETSKGKLVCNKEYQAAITKLGEKMAQYLKMIAKNAFLDSRKRKDNRINYRPKGMDNTQEILPSVPNKGTMRRTAIASDPENRTTTIKQIYKQEIPNRVAVGDEEEDWSLEMKELLNNAFQKLVLNFDKEIVLAYCTSLGLDCFDKKVIIPKDMNPKPLFKTLTNQIMSDKVDLKQIIKELKKYKINANESQLRTWLYKARNFMWNILKNKIK